VAHSHRLVLLPLLEAMSCCVCFLASADTAPTSYVIQTVAGSDDSGDGGSALSVALSQPEGIAVDHSGNVYVADAANHRVRKIATDGSIQTVAGTGVAAFAGDGGQASAALLNQPYGLALDSAGNLYIADLGNARVRKVATDGTIHTIAGGGTLPATGTGQGGSATIAQLVQPRNVAVDAAGSLYISDFGANQVYQVTSSGILSLVAGTGTAGFSGVGTSALLAELSAPAGLATDSSGDVYIADSGNNKVRKVYNGVIIDVFDTSAPTGVALDSTGMLYVAAAGYFGNVVQQISGVASARDVAVDSSGNIYATSGGFVLEIPSGGMVTTIAGSGNPPYFGGDDGPAKAALMDSPSGVVVDSSGNWYIADTANNRVRMVSTAGAISTIAGTSTAGSSGDNGPASAAELNLPHGIAIDGSGNLYIADTGNNEVRKITPAGTITTIASQLSNPVSVAVDAQGSVYIADSGNSRIAQVTGTGTASTFAKISGPLAVAVDTLGNVVAADASQIWKVSANGTATSLIGGLTSPSGLGFLSDGTLIIADTGANVVRQLNTSGELTSIAGTGTAGFSGDGSPALSAELNAPAGIAMAANGTLLIADSGNNRIRMLTPAVVSPETASISPVNAASLATGPIAPGEIITVFGTGFDKTNTQLLFDNKAVTLFYIGGAQINALAPASLAANSTTAMSVVVDGTAVAGSSVPVAAAAPGIFTTTGATGQAAATNQDGSLNSASNPAARGSVVSIYATGQGSGTPNVTMTIAGYNAPLLYAGPAPGFSGLMQINAQIPCGFVPPGSQSVVLSIGGVFSQANVTLAIDSVCI
jgi:trimeric autotransporter adhesin